METPQSPRECIFWNVESTRNGKKEIDFGLFIVSIYSGFLLGVEGFPHTIFSVCSTAFAFSFLPFLLLLSEMSLSIIFPILLKDCHPMYNNWLFEWCLLCTEYSESLTLCCVEVIKFNIVNLDTPECKIEIKRMPECLVWRHCLYFPLA